MTDQEKQKLLEEFEHMESSINMLKKHIDAIERRLKANYNWVKEIVINSKEMNS